MKENANSPTTFTWEADATNMQLALFNSDFTLGPAFAIQSKPTATGGFSSYLTLQAGISHSQIISLCSHSFQSHLSLDGT